MNSERICAHEVILSYGFSSACYNFSVNPNGGCDHKRAIYMQIIQLEKECLGRARVMPWTKRDYLLNDGKRALKLLAEI